MNIPSNSRILSAETSMDMIGIREAHYQLLHEDNTPVVGGIFKLNYKNPGVAPGISTAVPAKIVQKQHRQLTDDEGWIRVESHKRYRLRRSLQRLREKGE